MYFRKKPFFLILLILFSLILIIQPAQASSSLQPPIKESEIDALSYPPDPTSNISWSGGVSGVADIQSAFNNARNQENSQLGTSLPAMVLPTQAIWDGLTDSEKALWLVNQERVVRGLMPLDSVEPNVTSVAQYYADYLFDNDTWGHYEDGNSPWERLNNNPAIGACHDYLSVSENIAVFVTSGNSIPLPVERSVYMWLYDDAGSSWGHRHAILYYPYNDNSGQAGREGFFGIGRANGGPYQGPFSSSWHFAELIVMNVFDPCATWIYPAPEILSITRANNDPTGESVVNFTVTFSEIVSGVDISDFTLLTTGTVSGESILNVSDNPNTVYTVSINTGTGEGTIRLDLKSSNTNIINTSGTSIEGGFTGGEYYTTLTPPTNDDFGGAINISIVPSTETKPTMGATPNVDDPSLSACGIIGTGYATVWYKYTGTDSAVSLDTKTSGYDTFIAVWTGTRTNLTLVVCNNDANISTNESVVAFFATQDEIYYIEVGQP